MNTGPARRSAPRQAALVLLGWAWVTSIQASPAKGIDLGTIGPTYGIAEPHLLQFIQSRLRDKERTGELRRLMEAAQRRGIESVKQPAPVPGLQGVEGVIIYGNLLGQTQERGGGFDYTDDFGGGAPASIFIGGGIGINQQQPQ